MTEKATGNTEETSFQNNYKKLSIQVSLNGLSFCAVDTIDNSIMAHEKVVFKTTSTPYLLKKELKSALEEKRINEHDFPEVTVIHKNNLFGLVPKVLFDENERSNYLKFNTKILANDHIAHDEIESHDIINVYIPFTNINNYIFDLFGEFEFRHSGSVLVQTLMAQNKANIETTCYAHVAESSMEVVVITQKKLLFYNYFHYKTKEDFLYFILFTFEQLNLNVLEVKLKLFGIIEEGDDIFEMCCSYIKKVSVFAPSNTTYLFDQPESESIDFTVLSAL
ncbi:MAG: DUF3822 family protein [Bacteroidota bacterium]